MIVDLADPRALDSSLAGGKGSSLAALITRGMPVPPGFVITTRAFAAFLEEAGLQGEIEGLSSERDDGGDMRRATALQDSIRASRLPSAVARTLQERMAEAGPGPGGGTLWAVRSSAVAEDMVGASFAGQYDTVLGLAGFEEVAAAVLRCWASFFNPGSIEYRRARGISDFRGAIVVQRLIPSHAAGVCFTRDPVSGDSNSIVINSNFGLGESVVSGRVTPDTFVIDRVSGQVASRRLARKETKVIPAAGGTADENVEERLQSQASITDDQAIAIAMLAAAIEKGEDGPVDIEWAVLDGDVYLLQSRPITALPITVQPHETPPDGWAPEMNTPIDPRYPLYSNGNISEVLPGCITPLSWSYIGPTIEHAFRSQIKALGAVKDSGAEYQVLGFFYHRPYVCVSYLEAAAARTPGLTPDTIHEEFIGPPEIRTPPLSLGDLRPDRWPAIPKVIFAFLRNTMSLSGEAEKCEATTRLQRMESAPEKVRTWSDERLMEETRFSSAMTHVSDVHVWASTFAVVYFDILRKMTDKWLGDSDGSLAAQMVTSIGSLPSADPAFGLYDLAREAMASPDVTARFESVRDDRALLAALREDPGAAAFMKALDGFLEVYGHRAVCEAELRNPCWREEPSQTIGLVRNYLQPGVTPPREVRARQDRVRVEAAGRIDALRWPKSAILRRVLRASRRYIELRERLKDLIVFRSDRLRRIYGEACTRLVDRGLLSNRDDLYFLVGNEIRTLLLGDLGAEAAQEALCRRRRDFEWCQSVHVPKIMNGRPSIDTAEDFPADRQLTGTGVSPGRVEGRARVILDPRLDSHIEPGEILVAPVTDAGWTPLFITAGGLVIDVGGLLSHGSVVAREYGLPAVVGVTGATLQIKTGDRILVDGGAGTVIKLD